MGEVFLSVLCTCFFFFFEVREERKVAGKKKIENLNFAAVIFPAKKKSTRKNWKRLLKLYHFTLEELGIFCYFFFFQLEAEPALCFAAKRNASDLNGSVGYFEAKICFKGCYRVDPR
jgi:hypothetical protein